MSKTEQRPYPLSATRTIVLVLHYFVGYLFVYRILASQITTFIQPGAKYLLPSVQWGMYALTLSITLFLAWPSIKHSYRRFMENKKQNFGLIVLLCIIGMVVNIALSLSVSLLTKTTGSNNQNLIQEASNVIPLLTILSSCLFAPVVEECVFRSGVFAFLRKKLNFIFSAILSSLFFASIHFADALFTGNLSDISYLIVYAGIGIVMAYAYEKSDSIFVSGSVHFLNNAISMFAMFL